MAYSKPIIEPKLLLRSHFLKSFSCSAQNETCRYSSWLVTPALLTFLQCVHVETKSNT